MIDHQQWGILISAVNQPKHPYQRRSIKRERRWHWVMVSVPQASPLLSRAPPRHAESASPLIISRKLASRVWISHSRVLIGPIRVYLQTLLILGFGPPPRSLSLSFHKAHCSIQFKNSHLLFMWKREKTTSSTHHVDVGIIERIHNREMSKKKFTTQENYKENGATYISQYFFDAAKTECSYGCTQGNSCFIIGTVIVDEMKWLFVSSDVLDKKGE